MRTIAIVTKLYENGDAEVSVERRAACEGCHRAAGEKECSVCTLLGGNRKLSARARNAVGAGAGDTVMIESGTTRMLWYAVLIFLLPVLLMLGGYFAGRALWGETGAFASAGVCFLLPFVPLGVYSRRRAKHAPDITVTKIVKKNEDS